MRVAGMIGGLGPESTVDYYRMIIARYRERIQGRGFPAIVITSLDVDKGIAMLDAGQLAALADYLSAGVEQLARAGADFGFMAANTPHIVFDEVQRRSSIPLLSIVDAAVDDAKKRAFNRVGLMGTGFTMRASFYPERFKSSGITLVVPTESEKEFIHSKYIGELLKNEFLPETLDALLQIAQRMKSDDGVDAIMLAGTELPLLLRGSEPAGIQFLDTAVIHVEAIVDELLR